MRGRSFPGDAEQVAALTRAAVEGYRGTHVAATAKHFPGLGAATENTDDAPVSLTRTPEQLLGEDLPPFRAAIAARVPLVMASHAVYPSLDPHAIASQSSYVLQRLLRQRLGFRGVIVTDSIEAKAVTDALRPRGRGRALGARGRRPRAHDRPRQPPARAARLARRGPALAGLPPPRRGVARRACSPSSASSDCARRASNGDTTSMEIALATNGLIGIGGSETYLLTVAEHLQRLGHEVDRARRRGRRDVGADGGPRPARRDREARAARDLRRGRWSRTPAMAYALADRWPETPQVFRAPSALYDFQSPPQLPGVVAAVVVCSDRMARHVEALAGEREIVRLRQPIDIKRLCPRGEIRERPRRALLLGNYVSGRRRELIDAAWGEAGVEVRRRVGAHGTPAPDPAGEIAAADIVVGKARAILDAMACGRAAYVLDVAGGDGWVTEERYARHGGGQLRRPGHGAGASTAIASARPRRLRPGDGPGQPRPRARPPRRRRPRRRRSSRCSAGSRPRAEPATGPLRELARLVRLQWAADQDVIALRQALLEERARAVVAEDYAASLEEERERLDAEIARLTSAAPLARARRWRVRSLPSDRAPGLLLGPGVELPDDVALGGHVIIYDGVRDRARLPDPGRRGDRQAAAREPDRALGGARRPSRRPCSSAARRSVAKAVIVAGARLGPGAVAGDHSLIRERVVLEAGAVVGSGSGIGPGCRIGAGSRLMPGALLALDTVIEEGVFCGPRLIVTNDPAMGRQGPGVVHPVTTLRRGCRIAANVTLLPGVEIGEEAVVGASSLVTRSVPPRTVVVGTPARVVRELPADEAHT